MLFHFACQWLLQERLVRPGVTRIERLVATIRDRAQQETYGRFGTMLTPTLSGGLNALLQPTNTTGRTALAWLRENGSRDPVITFARDSRDADRSGPAAA